MAETNKTTATASNTTDISELTVAKELLTALFTALNTTITAGSKASVEVGESKGKFSLLMAQESHKAEVELLSKDPAYTAERRKEHHALAVANSKFEQDSSAIQQKFDNEMVKADFEFTKEVFMATGAYLKDLTEKVLPLAAMKIQQVEERDSARHEREEARADAEEKRAQERHKAEMLLKEARLREETARANEREMESKVRSMQLEKDLRKMQEAEALEVAKKNAAGVVGEFDAFRNAHKK